MQVSYRPTHVGHRLALLACKEKNTAEKMRGKWEIKEMGEGGCDRMGCTQVTSCHGERRAGFQCCSVG